MRRNRNNILQAVLGGFAGGLRGYADQQEIKKRDDQTAIANNRQALQDALAMAQGGIIEEPPEPTVPSVVPLPTAPDPAIGTRVRVGQRSFIVPTEMERARRRARAEDEVALEASTRTREQEAAARAEANRRAYETLRARYKYTSPYADGQDYAFMLKQEGELEMQRKRVQATAEARPVQSAQERLAAQTREQREAQAVAWFNDTFGKPATTPEEQAERNRIGMLYAEIAQSMQNPTGPAVMLALMEAYEQKADQAATEALAGQRNASATRQGGGGRAPSTAMPGTAGPAMPAPGTGQLAQQPTAASPTAMQAELDQAKEDYDLLLSLGEDPAAAKVVYDQTIAGIRAKYQR